MARNRSIKEKLLNSKNVTVDFPMPTNMTAGKVGYTPVYSKTNKKVQFAIYDDGRVTMRRSNEPYGAIVSETTLGGSSKARKKPAKKVSRNRPTAKGGSSY